ncbi:MAG: ABC transporter permease, partial [Saprospiraceae bacterium]|nr:ABC transporter permease [Saprospiraceae bacterium]
MLQNYFKIAWRNLRKNRTYVIINVLGLGIALACCIVAYLNWEYNATYDGHHEHAEEIYRVNFIRQMGGRDIANGSCPMPLALAVQQNIPQVEEAVRYLPSGANFKVETTVFSTGVAGVDPAFFDLFTFDFVQGSAASIEDERTLVIDEELLERHWPDGGNVIGDFMTLVQGDQKIEFKIGGVFKKQPENSSMQQNAYLHVDALLQIQDYEATNWALFNSTFLRIPDPRQVDMVTQELQDYVTVQNDAKEDYKVAHYYLDPFVGMAVRAEKEGTWNHWFSQSLPTAAAAAPGIMSLLLLLIACFNFTNTSIATANRRLKEIGIRKVMGSAKRQIIAQFWGENLLLTFLALALGILIAAFLVPLYSSMWAFL